MSQFGIPKPLTEEQQRIQMEKIRNPNQFPEFVAYLEAEEALRLARNRYNLAKQAWDDLGRT